VATRSWNIWNTKILLCISD